MITLQTVSEELKELLNYAHEIATTYKATDEPETLEDVVDQLRKHHPFIDVTFNKNYQFIDMVTEHFILEIDYGVAIRNIFKATIIYNQYEVVKHIKTYYSPLSKWDVEETIATYDCFNEANQCFIDCEIVYEPDDVEIYQCIDVLSFTESIDLNVENFNPEAYLYLVDLENDYVDITGFTDVNRTELFDNYQKLWEMKQSAHELD